MDLLSWRLRKDWRPTQARWPRTPNLPYCHGNLARRGEIEARYGGTPPRRYIVSIRRRGIKNSQRKFLTSPAGLPRFSLSREMYRRCYSGEKKKARRLFTSPRRIYEPSAGGIPRLTSPTSPKKINSCWELCDFFLIQCAISFFISVDKVLDLFFFVNYLLISIFTCEHLSVIHFGRANIYC